MRKINKIVLTAKILSKIYANLIHPSLCEDYNMVKFELKISCNYLFRFKECAVHFYGHKCMYGQAIPWIKNLSFTTFFISLLFQLLPLQQHTARPRLGPPLILGPWDFKQCYHSLFNYELCHLQQDTERFLHYRTNAAGQAHFLTDLSIIT